METISLDLRTEEIDVNVAAEKETNLLDLKLSAAVHWSVLTPFLEDPTEPCLPAVLSRVQSPPRSFRMTPAWMAAAHVLESWPENEAVIRLNKDSFPHVTASVELLRSPHHRCLCRIQRSHFGGSPLDSGRYNI